MTRTETRQGHASWGDLAGKRISFKWHDGWDDFPYHYEGILAHTRPYAEDPRYPRYYVIFEDGGGPSFWEDEMVAITVL